MSEEERISREKLVKRAAAAAGAIYLAPVFTSSAGAATQGRCRGQRCRSDARCRGHPNCRCINNKCTTVPPPACDTQQCGASMCCDVAMFCDPDGSGDCICFLKADDLEPSCVGFPSNFCSDYQTCSVTADCGAGFCCMCTCCPTGICSPSPCTSPLAARGTGSGSAAGPTLTRV